jgi:ribonuclease PH
MRTDRQAGDLRPLTMEPGVMKFADGSVLVKLGDTHVLCAVTLEDGVPGWRRGTGAGWLTAEYSMLPAATAERGAREATRGRQTGRTQEIQRLIGRSLRAVTDLGSLGERTVHIDCDVVQADGGTRTASISGA